MPNERTYPCLPCRELDESIAFYEALRFKRTYRQLRPNPYAVVARGDMQLHLFGMENFNPEHSYGSVIIVVPDPDALYHDFAAGLRRAYGKLPSVGIPRILRPRKKFGTVRGFSIVDPGGNWLRIYPLGEKEEDSVGKKSSGLVGIIEVAARLGDAHGDDAAALKTLENGLVRHAKAPAIDRVKALLYRAELAMRLSDQDLASSSLAEAQAIELDADDFETVSDDLTQTMELVNRRS